MPLAPPPADFYSDNINDDVAQKPAEDKIVEEVQQPPPPAEVTPEPEPQPQPQPQQQHAQSQGKPITRRWQSTPQGPSPAASRPSRADEEMIAEMVAQHADGKLIFSFQLPDGSSQEIDFTAYAMKSEPLGLDVDMQAPVTVGRIAPRSAACRLGVQSGWLITRLGEQSFEGKDPVVFCKVVKQIITNLRAESAKA